MLSEIPKHGEKTIEAIQKICDDNGINIYDVFREAKKPVSTIQNWTKREPGSLETLAVVKATLADMIKTKNKKEKVVAS